MKSQITLISFIALCCLTSCKKNQLNAHGFNGTTYNGLGAYDTSGLPEYLISRDSISNSLVTFIDSTLQNGVNLTITHPELFSSTKYADIDVTATSNVSVTFVSQGCSATNVLAFYSYPTAEPPKSGDDIKIITYIFPSAGNLTPLKPGDKVNIGNFAAGTTIGFALLENGWDASSHTVKTDVVHYCTDDDLNPEPNISLRRHAVLLTYGKENKQVVGFEDNNRSLPQCDNDFNDVVFYYTVQ